MVNPLANNDVYVEGNMESILEIVPINISRTPDVAENIFIRVDCSQDEIHQYTTLFKKFFDFFTWLYEEMLIIYPRIVKHEIRT
jgi:hypothetical protein